MEIKKIRLAVSHEVRKNIPLIQGSCSGSIVSNWVIKSGDTKKTAEIQIACVCSFASASRILGLSAKNVVHHSLFDLTFISRFHIAINCLKNIYYIYLSIYLSFGGGVFKHGAFLWHLSSSNVSQHFLSTKPCVYGYHDISTYQLYTSMGMTLHTIPLVFLLVLLH